MLKEAKLALRVTAAAYDPEIASLLEAGAQDLQSAGVQLPGTVSFTASGTTVTDNSTLTDPLAMRAILTYAAMRFGNPPNYDKLKDAYETQKSQLMHTTGYTDYGETDDAETDGTETAADADPAGGTVTGGAGGGDGT